MDGPVKIDLPPAPADLKACFGPGSRVPAPPKGETTERQLNAIIAALKQSELAHDQCGQRVIAWYEKLAAGYGTKGK